MNQNNNTDATEQSLNAPDKTPSQPKEVSTDDIAAMFAASFLKEPGMTDTEESETQSKDADPEQEATENQQEDSSLEAENSEEAFDEEPEAEAEDTEVERGLSKGVKKRIDKLTAKRREAEQKVTELEAEMERLKQEASVKRPVSEPTASNPYSNLNTPVEVQKEIEQAKKVRRWCEMNPDGASVKNDDGTETDYTAEEVRSIKMRVLDALEDHLPNRLTYIQQASQIEQIAQKEYPWWKDKSTREHTIAQKFLEAFPEITKFPDYKMVIGDYIRGVKTRESASKQQTTAKAPIQPKATGSPVKPAAKQVLEKSARQNFAKTGSREDLASIIASKFI